MYYGHRKGEGLENIFNKITGENFPNLEKKRPTYIQETERTQTRLEMKLLVHVIIKQKPQNNEKVLKAATGKGQVTYKGRPSRIIPNHLAGTLKPGCYN